MGLFTRFTHQPDNLSQHLGGPLCTRRRRKSRIYSVRRGPAPPRLFRKRPGSQRLPRPVAAVPRSRDPSPLPFVSSVPARPVNSAALAFTGRRPFSGSAGTGGRRPVAGQRPGQRAPPPEPRRPHQPVGAASPPLPRIVAADTKGCRSSAAVGPAVNYAPGHSPGRSLCGASCVPSRSQSSGRVAQAEALPARAGGLPAPPHPPPDRLCSLQPAARPARLSAAVRSLQLRPWALLPSSSFSLKLSAACKIPGLLGHPFLSLSQASPAFASLSLKF